jgi:hypothetical protein
LGIAVEPVSVGLQPALNSIEAVLKKILKSIEESIEVF